MFQYVSDYRLLDGCSPKECDTFSHRRELEQYVDHECKPGETC